MPKFYTDERECEYLINLNSKEFGIMSFERYLSKHFSNFIYF